MGKLQKGLPVHLKYHNTDHTNDVMQAAEFLAGRENINEKEKELLLTAALFHDSGFLKIREGHETESCGIARYYLPLYNYEPAEIDLICGMIMATRIPQSPNSKLGEILCDADLDYLGREDFLELSARLFTELKNEGIIKNVDEWNREQADFMGNHHYFTKTSVNLRQPKKEQHIDLIRSKITTQILK
jgi:uncharacterized protein